MGGAERVLSLPEAISRLRPSSGGTPPCARADTHRREALSMPHLRNPLPPPPDPQKPRSHPHGGEAIPREYPTGPNSYPPYTQAGPGLATAARFLKSPSESGTWTGERGRDNYILGLGTVVPRG